MVWAGEGWKTLWVEGESGVAIGKGERLKKELGRLSLMTRKKQNIA